MTNLYCTNLATRCGWKAKDTSREVQQHACYHNLIYSYRDNMEVTVEMYRNKYAISNNDNNYCLFDKEFVIQYLELLKSNIPFEYELLEVTRSEEGKAIPLYVIKFHVMLCKGLFKCLWTFLRKIYEFPYNFEVAILKKMIENGDVKQLTLTNLINAENMGANICRDQSFLNGYHHAFVKNIDNDLIERLKECSRLQDTVSGLSNCEINISLPIKLNDVNRYDKRTVENFAKQYKKVKNIFDV